MKFAAWVMWTGMSAAAAPQAASSTAPRTLSVVCALDRPVAARTVP